MQLEGGVGKDVRVASKEGSIEFHRARIIGGNTENVEVVYQDLPGVREVIDRRSNRLWHGTHDECAWEVHCLPSPCVPIY